MPTQEEIINEVLKFDPGRKQPTQADEDLINEVLKFDPGKIGGTYQPIQPDDKYGRPSGTSTITGEPLKSYVPGEEPSASMGALAKTVFADDPRKQIEIYAESRGIPASRYRIHNGEIIFRNKEGKWQRETGELPLSMLKKGAVQTAVNPAVIGGTLGAMGGPKGAMIGAMAGETARQAIGAGLYGDFKDPVANVGKAYGEGLLALAGEGVGAVVKGAIMGHRMGQTGLKAGATALRVSNLTPQDHIKAQLMRDLAKEFDIELPLHQAYDKASLENFWMYLRKHPATADKVKDIEKNLAKQGDEALQKFIKDVRGGPAESPVEVGEQAREAATGAIKGAEGSRAEAVYPMYQEGFKEADLAGGIDISPAIKQLDGLIDSYNRGPAQKILQSVKQKLGTEERVEIAKGRTAPGWKPSKEEEKGLWSFRSYVKKIGGIAVDDPKYRGEIREIAKGAKWGPGVVSSRAKGGNEMDILLAKIKESKLWDGIVDTEDDILQALERNPTTEATWGMGERKIREAQNAAEASRSSVTERGQEFKEALALRKQGQLPKSIFTPEKDLRKIQKALFEINDIIEGTAHEAATISPSSKNVLTRDLMSLKSQMLTLIGEKAPTFIEANERYATLSQPIDSLKRSVVGELSRLTKDKTTADATRKLFDVQNMPDADLVWRARASIEPQDATLWNKMVGSYLRDTYEGILIRENDPLIAFGQFRRKLFGSPRQQGIMEAALGKDKFKQFNDLMTVLNRTTVGTKGQSMTAQFQEMNKAISPPTGSKVYQAITETKRAAAESLVGRWNDAVIMGRHIEMLDAMLSDDAVKNLSKLKQLTPGSQKLIDGLSTYFGLLSTKVGIEDIGNQLPGEQSRNQIGARQ